MWTTLCPLPTAHTLNVFKRHLHLFTTQTTSLRHSPASTSSISWTKVVPSISTHLWPYVSLLAVDSRTPEELELPPCTTSMGLGSLPTSPESCITLRVVIRTVFVPCSSIFAMYSLVLKLKYPRFSSPTLRRRSGLPMVTIVLAEGLGT